MFKLEHEKEVTAAKQEMAKMRKFSINESDWNWNEKAEYGSV